MNFEFGGKDRCNHIRYRSNIDPWLEWDGNSSQTIKATRTELGIGSVAIGMIVEIEESLELTSLYTGSYIRASRRLSGDNRMDGIAYP